MTKINMCNSRHTHTLTKKHVLLWCVVNTQRGGAIQRMKERVSIYPFSYSLIKKILYSTVQKFIEI